MHSSSRRAFFRGRRLPQTPWEEFCQRVRRTLTGEFIEFKVAGAAGSGRITVQDTADVHHVRALCHEYGVVFCLDGLSMPVRQPEQATVWVRPGKSMSQLSRIDEHSNRWFVQPGCTLGDLVDAGFESLSHLPRQLTVAVWLADRTLSDYVPGRTFRSGLNTPHCCWATESLCTWGRFPRKTPSHCVACACNNLCPHFIGSQRGRKPKPV